MFDPAISQALAWIVLPLLSAAAMAAMALLHFAGSFAATTSSRGADWDVPNVWMAMLGGGVAGFLACLMSLFACQLMGLSSFGPFTLGILFAGLGGEYLGGRCDEPVSAAKRGAASAVILLPFGAGLLALLQ